MRYNLTGSGREETLPLQTPHNCTSQHNICLFLEQQASSTVVHYSSLCFIIPKYYSGELQPTLTLFFQFVKSFVPI